MIQEGIQFYETCKWLRRFEGMKYTNYDFKIPKMNANEPFWVSNSKLPEFSYIYIRGSTCVGLVNILRRYLQLEIPGIITGEEKDDIPGGTQSWFKYLTIKKRLNVVDFSKTYRAGTLLIQDFNNKDQGHVSIVISENNALIESEIIHNVNGKWGNKIYNSVTIEMVKEYPYYDRFTHICMPEKWLIKN